MKDFLLEENTNNLSLVNRDLSFTLDNSSYLAQKLKIRLSFFLGEWYLNVLKGIPYFDQILIKNPDLNFVEDLIKTEITTTPGVDTLESFNLTYENSTKELLIEFSVSTLEGEIIDVTI